MHASPRDRHALLAGGGTGGHVYPALALAEELRARGWAVTFAGRAGSYEERLARGAGLETMAVTARPLVGGGPLARLLALGGVAGSAWMARRGVRRRAIDAVVGTGSYVAAPAILGGHWAGRPTLLIEPNARPGVANRWLSRFADEAVVAFESTAAELRCPARPLGVPVRRAFFEVPAPPPAPPWNLLVLGGSQGARQINQLVPAAVSRVATQAGELSVVHQCGPAQEQETLAAWGAAAPGVAVEVVGYLDEVAEAMAAVHLVVARAGAMTIAELAAAGRPAVLIPLAAAAAHQVDNARAMERKGAAAVLAPGEVTVEALAAQLGRLLADRALLPRMAEAARRLARPRAASRIVDRLEELVEAA